MRRAVARAGLGPALAILAVLLVATPVGAHAFLDASAPPPNGHLPAGATVIALRFAETVDVPYTDVSVAAENDTRVPVTLDRPPLRPDEVRVRTDPLADGVYTLHWRALSVDGHPEAGRIRFAVGDATVTDPLPVAAREPRTTQAEETATEGVVRGLFLFSVLATMGALYHALEVDRARSAPRRIVVATMLFGAVATLAGLLLYVLMARRIDASLAATVHTVGGAVLLIKAGIAALGLVAAGVAYVSTDKGRRIALFFAGLAALFVVFVHSFGGHGVAAESGETDTAHTVLWTGFFHLVAVAVWVGGLVALVVLAPGRSREDLGGMIARFSPWALGSVVVLAGTGLYYAWAQLATVSDLWASAYGRWIVAKSLGFLALLGFGAWHQRRAGPALRAGTATRRSFRRSARAEATLMITVVLLAGLLAATPVPAPAVAVEDPPLRGYETHTTTGDHRIYLAVHPDPVVAGEPRTVRVDVRSETFTPYGEDAVEVSGAEEGRIVLEKVADGHYEATRFVFDTPGDETLRVTVTNRQGTAAVAFTVPVQPAR